MRLPLDAPLAEVQRRDPEARFYFCGDYCDRGPDTRGVVERLLPMVQSGQAVCCRGNHDDIFDLILNGQSESQRPGLRADPRDVDDAISQFWNEGLLDTFASYGIDLNATWDGPAAAVREAAERVPESHRSFFRTLPLVADEPDFFVVHASWPSDYPDEPGQMAASLDRQDGLRHEVLWGRYDGPQVRTVKPLWTRPGYVGHTPTWLYVRGNVEGARPGGVLFGEKLTLVDTAAFQATGRLSAVCHETQDVVQVHHSGEVL